MSKSQANQRTGRAGRECEGKCFRLYTEEVFEQLPETTKPEILRVDVAQVVLQLKEIGVQNVGRFPFLSPPSEVGMRKALQLLYVHLKALDKVCL